MKVGWPHGLDGSFYVDAPLDEERLRHWLARGAQPTNTVKKLMRAKGLEGAEARAGE